MKKYLFILALLLATNGMIAQKIVPASSPNATQQKMVERGIWNVYTFRYQYFWGD